MKTSCFFLHHPIRTAFLLLLGIGLISPTVHAQTFTSQAKLTESPPTGFRALVYAVVNRPGMIKVIFDNQLPGSVLIKISDQQGKVYYNEFELSVRYRQYFNLSLVPAGIYTVSLSKPYAVYTQTFRIEPPTPGRVIAVSEPSATETLIVKQ